MSRWATVPDVPPLPEPEQSGFVNSDGARIYYAVFNPHGGFASSDSWGYEVPRLVRDHEVIVMDTRGHGRSSMPAAPLSYAQMAPDAIAVLGD
jgi:pimeloyl-ACP methyl ester carboxylesterase